MRLFINADDGGFARRSDDAILRCATAGLVRNVTVVANGPTAREFTARALDAGLAVGLHVNFTSGESLTGIALHPKQEHWRRAVAGEVDVAELRLEAEAQFERMAGWVPNVTHVDGHNHVHVWPGVLGELARGRWVRRPFGREVAPKLPDCFEDWVRALPGCHVDRFAGYAFRDDPSATTLLRSVEGDENTVELMVHPGRRDGSSFIDNPDREREVECLCDPAVAAALETRGVVIGSFQEFPCTSP